MIKKTDQKQIEQILINYYKNNQTKYPWRNAFPYKLFVAEILLHKTPSKRTIDVYNKLTNSYPNVYSLSRASQKNIEKIIRPLGLIKRAEYLKKSSEIIVNEYNGIIPSKRKELLKLPGVGDYTASAILLFAYEKPFPAIDINVSRVLVRLLIKTNFEGRKRHRKIKNYLLQNFSKENLKGINYSLIDIGIEFCKKKPKCNKCILNNNCLYYKKMTRD